MHVKSERSSPERLLRRSLWLSGVRYRKNFKALPGKTDIAIPHKCLVIFVDGDFWHGRNWEKRKARLMLGSNSDYWIRKIAYNMVRDEQVNKALIEMGWQVLRIWETDLKKDTKRSLRQLLKLVQK